MSLKRHQRDTKKFDELTFKQQAQSINALIINLQKSIRYHVENAPNHEETNIKCLNQIARLLVRLSGN